MSKALSFLPDSRSQDQDRRNNYDVTNTVMVSSVDAVRTEVQEIFQDAYPNAAFDALWMAFHDFGELFDGQLTGYAGCDTLYHDRQHSLDVTLGMARLLAGYEKSCADADRLGDERAVASLICALFHDAGYIRRTDDRNTLNGAEFTNWHVSRSARFLQSYLPKLGFGDYSDIAALVVHFTGYEMRLDDIELDDPKDSMVGHLLGTADLIVQMADRCYLEKCRDRLYSEFVLAGVSLAPEGGGYQDMVYASGIDLLRRTPQFFNDSAKLRLDSKFNRVYRYVEPLYDGRNPYMDFIAQNLGYLDYLIDREDWAGLRRKPPCFTILKNPMQSVSALVSRHLADLNAPASALPTP